jgi:two-component system sensor histidine kinase YesM
MIISVSFATFFLYYKSGTSQMVTDSFQREADSIAQKIDNAVYTADRLLLQIKYNPVIEDTMYYAYFASDPRLYFARNEALANKLRDVVNSVTGVDPQFFNRVNVIGRTGAFISVGAYSDPSYMAKQVDRLSWFTDLKDDYRILLPPHKDNWDVGGRQVVSIVRKIESGGIFHSVIEIQIPYSALVQQIETTEGNRTRKIYLVDTQGEAFPLTDEESIGVNAHEEKEPFTAEEGTYVTQSPSHTKEIISFRKLHYSGWGIAVTRPYEEIMRPVRDAGFMLVVVALCLSVVSLAFIYFSASAVVKPLVQLSRVMGKVQLYESRTTDLEGLYLNAENGATHNEIVQLYRSFRKMLERLEHTKMLALEAHTKEMKSRFLALQAQIHPHFLYNTLSMIGMMGVEAGNEEILHVTSLLVQMFRYITIADNDRISLKDEMEYTKNYMDIMQRRYGDHLTCMFKVQGEMSHLRFPKLSIQPFVENCIKHGFSNRKYPWHIWVEVVVTNDGWAVLIEDDGSGFSEEFMAEMTEKIRTYHGLSSISGDGQENTGMLNTYARLFYVFGERLRFELSNREQQGSVVRLEGPIVWKEAAKDEDSARG